ncbi:hypothetical protein AB0D38_11010 [Streptomyces sp. NPDC048279]|uniref:hypothetical protein n=1 Tax=Streptomyces sp. NPDC048279 TaxID=3154714 RepID=UPI003428A994
MSLGTVLAVAMGTLNAIPASAVSTGFAAESRESQTDMTDAQKASREAVESGERVEVQSERTEYATTYANPDGATFSLGPTPPTTRRPSPTRAASSSSSARRA